MEHAIDDYDDVASDQKQRQVPRSYRDHVGEYEEFLNESRSKIKQLRDMRELIEVDSKPSANATVPDSALRSGTSLSGRDSDEFVNGLLDEIAKDKKRAVRGTSNRDDAARASKTVSAWITAMQPEVEREVFSARLHERRKVRSGQNGTMSSSSLASDVPQRRPAVERERPPAPGRAPRTTRTVEQRVANAQRAKAERAEDSRPASAASRHIVATDDGEYHDALRYLSQVYGGLWPPRRTNTSQRRPPYAHFANELRTRPTGAPPAAPHLLYTTSATEMRTVVTQTPVAWTLPPDPQDLPNRPSPRKNRVPADNRPAFAIRAPRQTETTAKAPPPQPSPPAAQPVAPKRREPYLVVQELPSVTIPPVLPEPHPAPPTKHNTPATKKERSIQVREGDIPSKVVRFGKQVQVTDYAHAAQQKDDTRNELDQTDPVMHLSNATQTRDADRPLPAPSSPQDAYADDDEWVRASGVQMGGRGWPASPQRFPPPLSRFSAADARRDAVEKRLIDAIERELVGQLFNAEDAEHERRRAREAEKDAELASILLEHELGALIRGMLPRDTSPPRRPPRVTESVHTPVPTPPPEPASPSPPQSYSPAEDFEDETEPSEQAPPVIVRRPPRGSPPRTPERTESFRDDPADDQPTTPLASVSEPSPRRPPTKVDREAMTTTIPNQASVAAQTSESQPPAQPPAPREPESDYSSPTHSRSEATETLGELVTEGQLLISAASVGERLEGLLANLRDADLAELERALATGTETSLADAFNDDDDETAAIDDPLRSEGEVSRSIRPQPSRRERRALELLLELHERGPRIASHAPPPAAGSRQPQAFDNSVHSQLDTSEASATAGNGRARPQRFPGSRQDSVSPSAASRTPTSLSVGQLVIGSRASRSPLNYSHADLKAPLDALAHNTGSFALSTSALSGSGDGDGDGSDNSDPGDDSAADFAELPSRPAEQPPAAPASRVIRIRPVEESADDNTLGVAESALVRGSQRTADVGDSVGTFDD